MAITRRPFLLDEGEELILSADALTSAERFIEFTNALGLDPEETVSDPVVTIPVPLYRRGARFTSVDASMMWLPLLWLPEQIGLRFQIIAEEGAEPRPESDVEWLVRVALELQASGLYDSREGWADVLALHGLDIENPVDLARVEAWQGGEPDNVLDAIDLTYLFPNPPEDAVHHARQQLSTILPAQLGLTAASLLSWLDEHPDQAAVVASLGAVMLDGVPGAAAAALEDAAAGGDGASLSAPERSRARVRLRRLVAAEDPVLLLASLMTRRAARSRWSAPAPRDSSTMRGSWLPASATHDPA